MNPLEMYLRDLHDIRATGAAVKETSYYPPLANLLNAVGQTLKPRVRCIINLKNQGAGMPDGGLFTPDQLQKGADISIPPFPREPTFFIITKLAKMPRLLLRVENPRRILLVEPIHRKRLAAVA